MGRQSQSQPQLYWGFPQIIAAREEDSELIGVYQQAADHFDLSVAPIGDGLSVMAWHRCARSNEAAENLV